MKTQKVSKCLLVTQENQHLHFLPLFRKKLYFDDKDNVIKTDNFSNAKKMPFVSQNCQYFRRFFLILEEYIQLEEILYNCYNWRPI